MTTEHEFVQLSDTSRVLFDLFLGSWIEDRKTGVDVPFVAVDTQRDVDLDVLDAADVTRYLPGELPVGSPGSTHGQEGSVGHGLCVGCYTVVYFGSQFDVFAS